METAVLFDRVYKHYHLGSRRAFTRYLIPGFARPGRHMEKLPGDETSSSKTELWALKDVSFEVLSGEVLGIIGPNGAGKTTTLSLLAGITAPTSGRVAAAGRVSALIRLGAGFHPDLTGRENIYLNASILGLKRREVDEIVDDIVAFAELERFIDTPVKRYSSGMYVRLGFSVAVHTKPEILLIDEVLAVGDSSFKAKCYAKIREIREAGATVIIVSHDMAQIKNLCGRAVLLDKQILWDGDVDRAIAMYHQRLLRSNGNAGSPLARAGSSSPEIGMGSAARVTDVQFLQDDQSCNDCLTTGKPFRIRISYQADELVTEPAFGISIHSGDGITLIGTNTHMDEYSIAQLGDDGSVEFIMPSLELTPGTYLVSVALHDRFMGILDRKNMEYRFSVVSGPITPGMFFPAHYWKHTANSK